MTCFDSNKELDAVFEGSLDFPFLKEHRGGYYNLLNRLTSKCINRRQPLLSRMNTANVARDLDLLREAVGDSKLTYLGFSYGSALGQYYANLFPQRVRSVVIDGVLNPSLWSSGLQILSDRNATAEVVEEFHRLCDEAKTNCPFWRRGGSTARFEALVEAIRKTPVVLPDEPPFRYDELIGTVVGFMYAPEFWNGDDGLAAFLASLSDAVEGRPEAAAQAQALRAALKAKLKREEPVEPYDNFVESYLAVYCTDANLPRSLEGFSQIDDLLGTRYGQYWWWNLNAACATWPAGKDRYTGPWSARTSSPVLIVGNRFDPATGYDGALASSRLLPNSRLLTYAGWGHTAFGTSTCATDAVLSYLKDGTLPKEGTVCPANANPFESVPSALSRQKRISIAGRPPVFPFFR